MVVHPVNSFMQSRLEYRRLRIQVVAALLAGLAFAFDIGAIYLILEGEAKVKYEGTVIVLMILYSLVPVLLWVLFAFAFYTIISLFGGRSEFSVLLRGTGWGMIPFAAAFGSLAVGRYLAISSRDPCNFSSIVCEKSTVVPLLDQVDAVFLFIHSAASSSTFQLLFGAFTVLYLLAGVMWWTTVRMSSNLTRLGVLVTVGAPVALFYGIVVSLTF